VIFKEVRQGRPYPEHGFSMKDWAQISPQQVRLADLVTTATVVELERLLSEDSTIRGLHYPRTPRLSAICSRTQCGGAVSCS